MHNLTHDLLEFGSEPIRRSRSVRQATVQRPLVPEERLTTDQRFIAEAQARGEDSVIQQLFATGFPVARDQLRLCKRNHLSDRAF